MSDNGISGINIGQTKLDKYEGNDENAALNSKGKFSNRTVRKFSNKVGSYLSASPTRSHELQHQQDRAQKTLNKRRIAVLGDQGDSAKAATNINKTSLTVNSGGKLEVASCPELDRSVQEFLALAKDPLANGQVGDLGYDEEFVDDSKDRMVATPKGSGARKIVDPEKFSRRIQKDLTVFLGNTIKTTNTPHGLERLRQTVQQQYDDKQLSQPQKNHLDKLLTRQYDSQLKNFPAYLDSLQAKDDSSEAQHELAQEKLEAIHEITIAAQTHNPALIKKHRAQLKTAALREFEQSATSTQPHENRFDQTKAHLDRIETEKQTLLKPVLQLTSRHPDERLQQADRSSSASRTKLQAQLDELPRLERAMQKAVQEGVQLAKTTADLKMKQQRLQQQASSLEEKFTRLGNKTGFRRLLKPYYRLKQARTLHKRAEVIKSLRNTDQKLESANGQYQALRNDYNQAHSEHQKMAEHFGNSGDGIVVQAPPLTQSEVDWSTAAEDIERRVPHFSLFDKACVSHHLNTLKDNQFDDSVIQEIEGHFTETLVTQKAVPFAALTGIFTPRTLVNFEDDLSVSDVNIYASDSDDFDNFDEGLPWTSGEFAEYLKTQLTDSGNPNISESEVTSLLAQVTDTLSDTDIDSDDAENITRTFVEYLTTHTDDDDPVYWGQEDLSAGLQTALDQLKINETAFKAVQSMEQFFLNRFGSYSSDTEDSDTVTNPSSMDSEVDSTMDDQNEVSEAEYVNQVFSYIQESTDLPLTDEQVDQLQQLFIDAQEDENIQLGDLNQLVFDVYLVARGGDELNFDNLFEGVEAGISILKKPKDQAATEDTSASEARAALYKKTAHELTDKEKGTSPDDFTDEGIQA